MLRRNPFYQLKSETRAIAQAVTVSPRQQALTSRADGQALAGSIDPTTLEWAGFGQLDATIFEAPGFRLAP